MNAVIVDNATPTTPAAALAAAHELLAEAHASAARASRTCERGERVLAEAQEELERLEQAESGWVARHAQHLSAWMAGTEQQPPALAADVKHAAAKLTATASAKAAQQALGVLTAAHAAAQGEVAQAEVAVREAAREVLFGEVRPEFDECLSLARRLCASRERLFAARLAGAGDALTLSEWMSLDNVLPLPATGALDIGIASEVPTSLLWKVGEWELYQDQRQKEARARVNALVPEFRARLAELVAGEAAERQEAAA